MELLQLLTSQLGVTEEQAKGGTGLLLQGGKEKAGRRCIRPGGQRRAGC